MQYILSQIRPDVHRDCVVSVHFDGTAKLFVGCVAQGAIDPLKDRHLKAARPWVGAVTSIDASWAFRMNSWNEPILGGSSKYCGTTRRGTVRGAKAFANLQ